MAYVGREPNQGEFKKIDVSSWSFDSSTTTFAAGFQIGNVNQVLLSINGVIQQPGTDFHVTAGGTTVIGFSMAGDIIPSGAGVLTTLSFSEILSDTTELSLGNFGTISDSDLNAYNVTLEGLIEHPIDCAGTYYGDLVFDDCGICGGD